MTISYERGAGQRSAASGEHFTTTGGTSGQKATNSIAAVGDAVVGRGVATLLSRRRQTLAHAGLRASFAPALQASNTLIPVESTNSTSARDAITSRIRGEEIYS
jgi:hypothetical protein